MTDGRLETTAPRSSSGLHETAAEWLMLIEENEASEQDLRRFGEWLLADSQHSEAYNKVERAWYVAQRLTRAGIAENGSHAVSRTPFGPSNNASRETAYSHPPVRRWAFPFAAACVGLVAAYALFWKWAPSPPMPPAADFVVRQTGVAEIRDFRLEDGSQVTLGPRSEIQYTAFRPTDTLRRVRLTAGEAYFDVVEDPANPFEVRIGSVSVLVTGTEFSIARKAGTAEIAVAEGSVRVATERSTSGAVGGNGPTELTVGERVIVSPISGVGVVAAVAPDRVGAWRSNRLIYSDAPLGVIVEDLRRYRGAPIVIGDADAAAIRISGIFNSADIDGVLQTLTELFPVDLQRMEDGSIELRSQN